MLLGWAIGCVEYGLGDPDTEAVPPVEVTETFVQAPYPGLDVLFVVDDTGSMAEEQAGLAAAAGRFLAGLAALGVDYQVGVTTTDPKDDGELVGRPWIITAAAEDPEAALAAALQVGTDAPPPAAGLDAGALAVEDPSGANYGFRRDDAALHVIFISDGDDASGAWLGGDPAAAFLAFLDDEAARTGRLARASAVIGDVPTGCSGPGGTALPGTRYAEVATGSGGRVVSICASDYGDVADAVGDVGVEWTTTFVLQATPSEGSVVVTVDGTRTNDGWTVDPDEPALVFAEPPAADATIVVRYLLTEGG